MTNINQKIRKNYQFLFWLRSIGVCLIIYDHLGPLRNPEWFAAIFIKDLINKPLGIIQDFGALGVCLFFIISGFCLNTNISSGYRFIIDKIIRVIVALLLTTFLFFCFNKIISLVFGRTYWDQFTLMEWGESSILACYLFGRDSVINGVTWYLFPLMSVYILWGICYRLLKRNPVYMVALLDIIFVVFWYIGSYRENIGGGGRIKWLVFMLIPMFGVLIRGVSENNVSTPGFIALSVLNYWVLVRNIALFRPEYYSEQPYLISLVYAFLLFCIFFLLEDRITLPKIVRDISNISFSLYLLHMTFGGLLMSLLEMYAGFTLSFFLSVVLVVILSWAYFKWIEKGLIGKLRTKFNQNRFIKKSEGKESKIMRM